MTGYQKENPQQTRFPLIDEMYVERGDKSDWDALHHLHYKSESLPVNLRIWRCCYRNRTVGIVVTSGVHLLLRQRHMLLPRVKPTGKETKAGNVQRANWINDNIRRTARIVTAPMYRGTGIGYRMVNLVMRMEGMRYVEILSAMSKFNPFDRKAGFLCTEAMHGNAHEAGVSFLSERFECNTSDIVALHEELTSLPTHYQAELVGEMQDFYYRYSSKEKTGANLGNDLSARVAEMNIKKVIKEIHQLVYSQMVYGLYRNPDYQRKLPQKLPLNAFDNQGVRDPLNLEKI
jgi:ABC-type ATPase with predicted acetyltransferase domain